MAGEYSFQVSISNPTGLVATSTVFVLVNQKATSVTVSPSSVQLGPSDQQPFSATELDQFGDAMATQPTFSWSLDSGSVGTIGSASGIYTGAAE